MPGEWERGQGEGRGKNRGEGTCQGAVARALVRGGTDSAAIGMEE